MHDRNLSLAAQGKAKESVHWQLGWWDLCHSLEGTRRPVQWSKSSVIYMAHESEPRILGRHFPTSRQFLVTPPFPFPLESYDPPTILSISSTDDWMFAYFPGKGCAGFGCCWRKEAELDNWVVKEVWSYPIGGGIVTAVWSCAHREWIVSDAGLSSRLPPTGPLVPAGGPLLILVTEPHLLYAFAMSSGKPLQLGRVSLLQPTDPAHPFVGPDSVGEVGGDKICTKAAIGLCYQESTVLVAMRSQLLPSQQSNQAFQDSMDLGLSIDLSQRQAVVSPLVAEWEVWGEEQTISLCEVRIEQRLNIQPVMSRPLPPIYHSGSHLVDLAFYSPLPSQPSPSPSKLDMKDAGGNARMLYLAATFFDVDDYTSLPKSEIVSFTFLANGQPSSYWALREETNRFSQTKVPFFLLPSVTRGGYIAGFLDAGGLLPRRKSKLKETTTGAMVVLKIPDLSAHEDWDSVPIHSHVQAGTVDVPVSVALSPNDALICCVSSSLLGSHQSIQVLPRRVSGDTSLALAEHLHGDFSKQLVAAIRARHSPSDIIHALAMPSMPTQVTVDTLHKAFTIMEADSYGHMEMWTAELLGAATEVYSARTDRLDRGPEQDLCAARCQATHEMLSLAACCGAFETCREGDSYDLDAVWQLVGITSWVIELIEKLFKECIFIGERADADLATPGGPDSSKGATLDSPIFLHLLHPYALSRLRTAVEHVKRFHDQVAKLSAKGENSHIAKDFLMDITEGSGVDLKLLGPFLADILRESKSLNNQDLQRSLASCSPVPALIPQMRKVIDKVSNSKAVDRARLFIKPSDLSDGITRLTLLDPSLGARPGGLKDKNQDVVKKNALRRTRPASVCVRCGGRSEVTAERKFGAESSLSRWQAWEKSWQMRCVCGGMWSSAMCS